MTVVLVLISISMLVAGGFLLAFIWAVKNGQYDDTYSPSVRMLFDNKLKEGAKTSVEKKKGRTIRK